MAGCAAPTASVTDASAQGISFLVQNVGDLPEPDVDAQAAAHCEQHGLGWRRAETVRTSPTSMRFSYDCIAAEQPRPKKVQVARRPQKPPAPAAKTVRHDTKSEAWAKARTAADAWAFCLRSDAERLARETREPPQKVVQTAVRACSGLERAVHDPLAAAGEDSERFQQDLHMQAEQTTAETVVNVRAEGPAPASPMVSGNERRAPQ